MWNSFFAICLYCEIASRSLVWLSKMARCICRIWRSADLRIARKSVIIESPFLRTARAERFIPIFHRLKKRGVAILLNTKPLEEYDEIYKLQVQKSLSSLQSAGVDVLFTVKHHRKLAIIDRKIIYDAVGFLKFMQRFAYVASKNEEFDFEGFLEKYKKSSDS